MTRRLSDTASLVGKSPGGGENYNISLRQVDNGYVVCQSSCDPHTGEYRSSEQFYKERPRIMAPRVARGVSPDVGEGGLRDTMNYLNNDK